jgi:REP element-mobilizing transposase RayT
MIMSHSYTRLMYHVVFATKNREPWLKAILREVHAFLGGVIREENGTAIVVGGVDDHVHLLVALRPSKALSDIVRSIKARSSGWIHRTFPDLDAFAWQTGFSAFTVSQSKENLVRRYIENQPEHHAKVDLKTEMLELLRLHEITPEEAISWE